MNLKVYTGLHSLVAENGYLRINLEGQCNSLGLAVFQSDLEKFLEGKSTHIIINCELLTDLSMDWIRACLNLQSQVRNTNKKLFLIQVSPVILQQLKKAGLDKTFKICKSLKEALMELDLISKKTLDAEFVNPFLTSTLHVLKVQAGIPANAGRPYIKGSSERLSGDISGIIGIVSENFNGSVIISFPQETFLKVMTGMLGEACTELTQDIIDGAGEITNMIFGQTKIILNEIGYGIKTALPSVVTGKDHSLSSITTGRVIVIPFESSAGNFFVEICLSE